jgi:hypothetical protein
MLISGSFLFLLPGLQVPAVFLQADDLGAFY